VAKRSAWRLCQAGGGDWEPVARLAAAAGQGEWDAPALAQWTARPGVRLWLARDPGAEAREAAPAGFLLARRVHDELEVLALGVAPSLRRRGIGRALLRAAEAAARAEGARVAHLEVRWGNRAARRLYRKEGYTEVGRRRGYYDDGEDARRMRRSLEEPR